MGVDPQILRLRLLRSLEMTRCEAMLVWDETFLSALSIAATDKMRVPRLRAVRFPRNDTSCERSANFGDSSI